MKYWDPAKDGGGAGAGKEEQLAETQSTGAVQGGGGGGGAKPETETKKQPPRKARGQEAGHPAATFPGGPTQKLSAPSSEGGGDSQAKATRTAPWEEEAAPGWGLGWKCQVASQVAMATETKRGAEKRPGAGSPRGAPAAGGP